MIKKTTNSHLCIILIVLMIAFALRMLALNAESVWHDEAWSIRAMRAPFITPDDKTPFLYYLTGHVLQIVGAGNSPLALRYISVLYGVVGVAFGAAIARRWFGIYVGLCFGICLAVSPLLWEYSQEVRAYIAVPLWALGLLACADVISQYQPHTHLPYRLLATMVGLEIGVLYTHNLGVPLVVWVNVALGAIWFIRWDVRKMMIWAIAQIGVIAVYLPWMLTQAPSGTALNTPPMPSVALMREIWRGYFLPVLPQLQQTTDTGWLDGLGMLLLVLTAGMLVMSPLNPLVKRRSDAASPHLVQTSGRHPEDGMTGTRLWLIGSQVFLLPIFSTALFIAASIDFHPRYYIASAPATLLWLLIGGYFIAHHLHRWAAIGAVATITMLSTVISAVSIQAIATTRAYQHDDFVGLAQYYAQLPAEAVILIPFDVERALQDYYADLMPIRARFVNIPIYSDEETALDVINQLIDEGVRHLEFLTWYQVPADVRGMYPCLLTVASDFVGEQVFFYGLSTQTYRLAKRIAFKPLDILPQYAYFEIIDAGYATSSRGTCIKTSWRLKTPFDEDLAVASALSTRLSDRIGDDDALIARDDGAGTSRWRDGDVGTAYNLIQLPEGAPLRHYRLHIAVYSSTYPAGFDILDGAGNPMGVETILVDAIYTDGGAFSSPPPAPSLVAGDAVVQTGVPFRVTVVVPANSRHIQLRGDTYHFITPIPPSDRTTLAWAQFIIPPNSGEGDALLLVDEVVIHKFAVEDVARIFTQPDTSFEANAHFIGVGRLVGYDVEAHLSNDQPFSVRLVWRADQQANPTISYTVFVQLLDETGRVVAQSDAQPNHWQRPTTSWIAREYIIDEHTLHFNRPFVGAGNLIVGFYDANDNFRRVMTEAGTDFAALPTPITVSSP